MKSVLEERASGRSFFDGVETIRTSMYSHYLISNSDFLEINAMRGIYFELKSIEESIDRVSWGFLYPIYKFYLWCRLVYRRTKSKSSIGG